MEGFNLKSFSEKSRDFLYDMVDYIIILAVVAGVVCVINWRIGVVFDNKITTVANAENVLKGTSNEKAPNLSEGAIATSTDDSKATVVEIDTSKPAKADAEKSKSAEKPAASGKKVTLKIPSGSATDKIAQIVVDSNLASSKADFLKRVSELKLETKLRSGDFTIDSGADLDTVIKTIAGKK